MAFGDPLATLIAAGVGYLVEADDFQEIRDALRFLKGLDGEINLEDSVETEKYFRGKATSINITANTDNLDTVDASFIRLVPDAATWSITGLTGGADGRFLFLWNGTGNTVTLAHQDVGSTAANRLDLPGGVDFDLTEGVGITLVYILSRWRALGLAGSFVPTDGAHTINDVKTFSSIPVLPASNPTTDNQAVRKAYVDGRTNMEASDVLIAAAPTDRSDSSGAFTKVKDITIGRPGEYRIAFDLRASGGDIAKGEVRRNGTLVGSQQTTASGTDVNFSQDIGGWSANDACELWVAITTPGQQATVSDFEVHGSLAFTVVTD